jgi:hypothetical protein
MNVPEFRPAWPVVQAFIAAWIGVIFLKKLIVSPFETPTVDTVIDDDRSGCLGDDNGDRGNLTRRGVSDGMPTVTPAGTEAK